MPTGRAEDVPPPLSIEEAEGILGRLEDVLRERQVVLIGGQAVAVWVNQLADRLPSVTSQQVASRDIDFLGARAQVQRVAELLDAKVYLAHAWRDRMNPLSGVATFLDGNKNVRRLDFLHTAYGMSSDDIRETAIEISIEVADGRSISLWVMHPERCMESRVFNSELAGKQTELAWRQLAASIACARAFSELLVDDAGDRGAHAEMKLNERICDLASQQVTRGLFERRGVDVLDAVVDDPGSPSYTGRGGCRSCDVASRRSAVRRRTPRNPTSSSSRSRPLQVPLQHQSVVPCTGARSIRAMRPRRMHRQDPGSRQLMAVRSATSRRLIRRSRDATFRARPSTLSGLPARLRLRGMGRLRRPGDGEHGGSA